MISLLHSRINPTEIWKTNESLKLSNSAWNLNIYVFIYIVKGEIRFGNYLFHI